MAKPKNNKPKPKAKSEGVAGGSKNIVKSQKKSKEVPGNVKKATSAPKLGNEKVKAKNKAKAVAKALAKKLDSSKIPTKSLVPTAVDPVKSAKKKEKKLKQKLKKQAENNVKGEQQETTTAGANVEQPIQTSTNKEAKDKVVSVKENKKKKSKQPKPTEEKVRVKLNTNEANDKTIFVGNLPVNTKRVQLLRLFQECGKVLFTRIRTASGKNIFKHKARKEAGALIAYVVLETAEVAKKALTLNGAVFKGNHLRITRADKKTTQESEDMDAKRTIFVGNLKYTCTEDNLHDIFTSCGEIEYVRCLRDDKGCKGVAYVLFKSPDSVGLALELNGSNLEDRPIHVERYSVKKLGAKQSRDEAAAREGNAKKTKPLTGARKRLDIKNKKQKQNNPKSKEPSNEKKKSEFRGVKVDGIKKKKNKKKSNSEMKQLAKKIAPKT